MKIDIEKASFKKFNLEEIAKALQVGLSQNYKIINLEIVDCPNLKNWGCPAEGLSGNQKIIDVGGEPYMHDKRYIGAEFNYEEIAKLIGSEKSYALGAGSGAMSCLEGHCGELIIDDNLITKENKSIIAKVGKNKECITEEYNGRKHGGLGNIFYSDGKKEKVLKIRINGRSGKQGSLPQAIRAALISQLNLKNNNHIALGGIFRILKGQIRAHIQPDYENIKYEYYDPKLMKCTKDFLQFYEPVGPNLQCYSVLWTGDPTEGKLNLRESGEHTHFYDFKNKSCSGHYHYDVTPDEIEYECYFNTANTVYRVNNIYKELLNKIK